MGDYSKFGSKSYDELIREKERLETEYKDIEEESLKNGLAFQKFCEKSHDVKEKLFFIDKYIRIKQEPVITYGKEWDGILIEIEDFKNKCNSGFYSDEDGVGYYASESSKSDIKIYPSDVIENILRNDFPYVIWF